MSDDVRVAHTIHTNQRKVTQNRNGFAQQQKIMKKPTFDEPIAPIGQRLRQR